MKCFKTSVHDGALMEKKFESEQHGCIPRLDPPCVCRCTLKIQTIELREKRDGGRQNLGKKKTQETNCEIK